MILMIVLYVIKNHPVYMHIYLLLSIVERIAMSVVLAVLLVGYVDLMMRHALGPYSSRQP